MLRIYWVYKTAFIQNNNVGIKEAYLIFMFGTNIFIYNKIHD